MTDMEARKPSKQGAEVRAQAIRLVDRVVHKKQSLESLIERARGDISVRDQGLFTHLVQGALRWYLPLRATALPYLDQPLQSRDQILETALVMGLYQAKILEQPDYAVIDTTVEATKLIGKPKAAGLVNAVLRKAIATDVDFVAGEGTHPEWFAMLLQKHLGDSRAHSVMAANDQLPPIWLRIAADNQMAVQAKLADADIELLPVNELPNAYLLPEGVSLTQVLSLGDGYIAVQDVSAQVLGKVLEGLPLAKSARVLDACAAPGGKTMLMAQQFPDWQITAVDSSAKRLSRLRENLAQHHLEKHGIMVAQADLTEDVDFSQGASWDLIVLDAPCSAIGVMRRHPDIRHLRVPDSIARVSVQQQAILTNLWQHLAPEGILIYITCSYLPEETDQLLQQFVETRTDVEVLPLPSADFMMPRAVGTAIYPDQLIETTQGAALMDGFYYAALCRQG